MLLLSHHELEHTFEFVRQTRESVSWDDIYSPLVNQDASCGKLEIPSCDSYAGLKVMFALSMLLNISLGVVIWRVPLFRGVIMHVLNTILQNSIRAVFATREVGDGLRNARVSSDDDLQEEDEELRSRDTVGSIVQHDARLNELKLIQAPPCDSTSSSRSISMPSVLVDVEMNILHPGVSPTDSNRTNRVEDHVIINIPG